MPSSGPTSLTYMCRILIRKKPLRVLDIGIGHGKWGFLVREYVDLWVNNPSYTARTAIVDGIEVYEPYITELQKQIYDNIYIGNALELLKNGLIRPDYDMIMCCNVLEHFEKNEAIEFLHLLSHHAKESYVILPVNVRYQDPEYGNEYERHKSQWLLGELETFGNVITLEDDEFVLRIKGDEYEATE